MIIRNSNNTFFQKYLFTKRMLLIGVLFFLVLIALYASRQLQKKGYTGLWDFVSTVSLNYYKGTKAQPEQVSIEIKENDLKVLEKNRAQALERGLIINDLDGDYVPAEINYNGKKIKVELRLKGHMTDHLQDNKWSFRIKVKDKDYFMGMKRFTIQHPGTRGYIYEWIYHELMKRENIIALRYKFVNVLLNGKDWGIYAVEENFDNELLENNNRPIAPIVRFNPDLYWVDRYNELVAIKPISEFASYYSADIKAYREEKIIKDSIQLKYYLKTVALIEGVRSKKLSVDEVFDIERLAKLHAIIDLVGGQHSIDWSDIKYYYNPLIQKLEPVAYESFTVFPFRSISGTYKYTILDGNQNYEDWHQALFSNTKFFKEYIKQLEKVADPNYLDSFFDKSNQQLNQNLAILYKEFPYKKFDKQNYYDNQYMISKLLNAPKAFHAYFDKLEGDKIQLQIGPIESLPMEIYSLSIGNNIIELPSSIILPAKQEGKYVNFKKHSFILPKSMKWDISLVKEMRLNYTVLGGTKKLQSPVFPFPHTNQEFVLDDLKAKQGTLNSFSFLIVNEKNKSVFIKTGKQIVDRDLIVPAGYSLIANGDIELNFVNNARLISYSPLVFSGTEDKPLLITSTDSTFQGIEIIAASKSTFSDVTFITLPKLKDEGLIKSAITFYESPVTFVDCQFYNTKSEDAVNLTRSDFYFERCLFQNTIDDAIDINFSSGKIINSVFENCGENALDVLMSHVELKSIYINGAGNKAINVKDGAELHGNDIRIKNANIAISAEDLSIIELENTSISNSEFGIVAYKNKPDAGRPTIKLAGLKFSEVNKNYLKEKKSIVVVNNIEIVDEVKNVEAIIKRDKKKFK